MQATQIIPSVHIFEKYAYGQSHGVKGKLTSKAVALWWPSAYKNHGICCLFPNSSTQQPHFKLSNTDLITPDPSLNLVLFFVFFVIPMCLVRCWVLSIGGDWNVIPEYVQFSSVGGFTWKLTDSQRCESIWGTQCGSRLGLAKVTQLGQVWRLELNGAHSRTFWWSMWFVCCATKRQILTELLIIIRCTELLQNTMQALQCLMFSSI